LQGGFGGTPTADSRFAVPCPSDWNALRNPPRQHVPTVTGKFEEKIGSYLNRSFFGFLLARKSLSQNLQKKIWCFLPIFVV
jgi:hypothetical protein